MLHTGALVLICSVVKIEQKTLMNSSSGNRTPVFRVTGGDTCHYTNEDCWLTIKRKVALFWLWLHCTLSVWGMMTNLLLHWLCTPENWILKRTEDIHWQRCVPSICFKCFIYAQSCPHIFKTTLTVNNSNGKWRCSESKNIVCQNILTSLWWKITET